jgi:integrase
MKEFDVVQAWLDNVAYSHSKNSNTVLSYRFSLEQFCKFVEQTPQAILKEYETADDKVFRRKYAQYLRAYIGQLSRDGFAPNTMDSRVGAVKSFFKHNDLPLAYVPTAKKKVIFHNRDIAKEEIQNILKVSDPRDKAFYTMMAQSGLRPETLCNLRLKHIEPEFSQGVIPCKIDVPQELAKGEYGSYFTFMGEESVSFLKAYFSTRPGITKDDYLFTNHGTRDQANPKSFSRIFARTIQKLREKGILDYELRADKPSELRLYNLRKYFKKHAGQMGSEESEFLMGHKQGVKDHYLPKDPEHYRQLYKEKAMPNLRLESSTPLESDKQIQELRGNLESLKAENQTLKEQMNTLLSPEIKEVLGKFSVWSQVLLESKDEAEATREFKRAYQHFQEMKKKEKSKT